MLLEKIQSIRPKKLLDIGCGCGEYTKAIAPYCCHITAIDVSDKLIEKCRKENIIPGIEYLCMDGRKTGLPDKSFDCVIERASLHHMTGWDKAIDEMLRLSNKYVLITEPLDSDRTKIKQNLNEAQNLFLEVQHDAGYEHYNHLKEKDFAEYFESRGLKYECTIDRFDDPVGFEEYFSQYGYFADRTSKKDYWMDRLQKLKTKLNGGQLCGNDVINIYFEV